MINKTVFFFICFIGLTKADSFDLQTVIYNIIDEALYML